MRALLPWLLVALLLSCGGASGEASMPPLPANLPSGPSSPIDGEWKLGELHYRLEAGKMTALGHTEPTWVGRVLVRNIAQTAANRYTCEAFFYKHSRTVWLPCTLTVIPEGKRLKFDSEPYPAWGMEAFTMTLASATLDDEAWFRRQLSSDVIVEAPAGGLGLAATASATAQPAAEASGESRHALVIGNSAYRTGPLRNPVRDANAMAKALASVGFEVDVQTNLSQRDMKKAIKRFGGRLHGGGVGLFYYAGHGMQVNGENYLVPVGAAITTEADVDIETVRLAEVLAKMDGAKNRLNVVVLDACRNNPFARSFRSASRGLAMVDAPDGTLIAYATAPGAVADDGRGDNGVYTGALIKHVRTHGAKIEEVFKSVRIDVRAATAGKQTPWESSSLTGDFYFVPKSR